MTSNEITMHQWFEANPDEQKSTDPAREAFQEGLRTFKNVLTKDQSKVDFAVKATNMEDMLDTVVAAQRLYESVKHESKIRDRLQKLTRVLQYYGNILDMLVQHHPEYVALAWGAMKFLFVTFLNHDATLSVLTKGLCKIGSLLPRLQLATFLYPTKRMKSAVAELYAYIMKFLIRAHNWFRESLLQHAWHAISRPSDIRYKDLTDEIETRSHIIESLAVSGSQAEQRVMHHELKEEGERVIALQAEVREIKTLLLSFQAMSSSAFIDTNERLSDLQLSNVLDFVANTPLPDPKKALNWNLSTQSRRQTAQKGTSPNYSWLTPDLKRWSEHSISSLIIVRGRFQSRFDVKHLAANLVELLLNAGVLVIWVLKADYASGEERTKQPSAIDAIKYLISQVIRAAHKQKTESFAASICSKFRTAATENEWLLILGSVLEGISDIYILIDIETFASSAKEGARFWPAAFVRVFDELLRRGCKTRVKVALMAYGSAVTVTDTGRDRQEMEKEYQIQIVRQPAQPGKMKAKKGPGRRVGNRNNVHGRYGMNLC